MFFVEGDFTQKRDKERCCFIYKVMGLFIQGKESQVIVIWPNEKNCCSSRLQYCINVTINTILRNTGY